MSMNGAIVVAVECVDLLNGNLSVPPHSSDSANLTLHVVMAHIFHFTKDMNPVMKELVTSSTFSTLDTFIYIYIYI